MHTKVSMADEPSIREAAGLLRAGEVVAFPTETVYGLGANGLDAAAVMRIFEAKERPCDNPLILHIARAKEIQGLTPRVDPRAWKLMERFWPGPLTLIHPKAACVPDEATGGLGTVAVRMPAHPVALALIRAAGCPIAAPSANRSGRPSPTRVEHVLEDLDGRIPLILDGGPSRVGVESTVLDLTGSVPVLLRPGGITAEMLLPYVPDLQVDPAVLQPMGPRERPRSPGMKYRHYAPRASLSVVTGSVEDVRRALAVLYDRAEAEGRRAALLVSNQMRAALGARRCVALGDQEDVAGMTARLFDALRTLDAQGVEVAYSQGVDPVGMGLAMMNRLSRAAAFQTLAASEIR